MRKGQIIAVCITASTLLVFLGVGLGAWLAKRSQPTRPPVAQLAQEPVKKKPTKKAKRVLAKPAPKPKPTATSIAPAMAPVPAVNNINIYSSASTPTALAPVPAPAAIAPVIQNNINIYPPPTPAPAQAPMPAAPVPAPAPKIRTHIGGWPIGPTRWVPGYERWVCENRLSSGQVCYSHWEPAHYE